MKIKKIYIGLIVILLLALGYLMETAMRDTGITMGEVAVDESSRPAQWQNIIASDVNSTQMHLEVDGEEIHIGGQQLYMNRDMGIMIPADIFRDVFKCAFNKYDDTGIVLQKGNIIVQLVNGATDVLVNTENVRIQDSMLIRDGIAYINAAVLEKGFGYDYKWDAKVNTLKLVDMHKDESILPAVYSYRKIRRLPSAKNQGSYSTCWAFASLTALESSLLPKEYYVFSVDNMVNNNGYVGSKNEGGNYTRAMAYLTAWRGPVLEADDIYGDEATNTDAPVVKHVQEAQIIESKNLEAIKRAVFLYGGVESALYSAMNYVGEHSMYYNELTNSYCYIGTQRPNHDIVIIGWDDHYPKENFSVSLEGDGAFLCINSWGAEFGDHGLFYVSYYDSNIGIHNVVYTKVEDVDNYDHIYQSDICGWVGQLGYEEESAFFSNVYTAQGDESLEAAGFYATGKNTAYELYLVKGFEDEKSFDSRIYLQSGSFMNAGYYTVPLNVPVQLHAGERYAIVVRITTPNAIHPIAIEYRAGRATSEVILDDGEGYISLTGGTWEHVEETKACNLCLKIYTKDFAEDL